MECLKNKWLIYADKDGIPDARQKFTGFPFKVGGEASGGGK